MYSMQDLSGEKLKHLKNSYVVIIKLKLWPATGDKAKAAAKVSFCPLQSHKTFMKNSRIVCFL